MILYHWIVRSLIYLSYRHLDSESSFLFVRYQVFCSFSLCKCNRYVWVTINYTIRWFGSSWSGSTIIVKFLTFIQLLFTVALDCSRRRSFRIFTCFRFRFRWSKTVFIYLFKRQSKQNKIKRIPKASSAKSKFEEYYKSSLGKRM